MLTNRIFLMLLSSLMSLGLWAQAPTEVQQLVDDYRQQLQERSFDEAAKKLHLNITHVMSIEEWVQAQHSTVNEDMATRTTQFEFDQQRVETKKVGEATYYLFTIPEELQVNMQREQAGKEAEIPADVVTSFQEVYGRTQVRPTGPNRLSVKREHQIIVLPSGGTDSSWRILDFPDGRMYLAYGILPAGVWDAFFPNEGLTTMMPVRQAVRQTIGHYFQLLKAKDYDGAKAMIAPQGLSTTPFLQGYQSLDTDYSKLGIYNYRLTEIMPKTEQDDKRYTAAVVEWTLMVELTDEVASDEDQESMSKILAALFPNGTVSYEETIQTFSVVAYRTVVAVADQRQNNWQLIWNDETQGMTIDKIPTEVLRAIGFD